MLVEIGWNLSPYLSQNNTQARPGVCYGFAETVNEFVVKIVNIFEVVLSRFNLRHIIQFSMFKSFIQYISAYMYNCTCTFGTRTDNDRNTRHD